MLEPLGNQPSLQAQAYESIRRSIVLNELKPGERLATTALAERLGISRSPVREALHRLLQEGLVEIRGRTGMYVATVSAEEVDDVFRIRGALEGCAAALAAERATDEAVLRMQSVLERMRSHVGSDGSDEVVEEADHFHEAVLAAAQSPPLLSQLGQIHQRITYFRNLSLRVPGRAEQAAREHEVLLTPIRSRDPVEAERIMRDHIDQARRVVVSRLADRREEGSSWV